MYLINKLVFLISIRESQEAKKNHGLVYVYTVSYVCSMCVINKFQFYFLFVADYSIFFGLSVLLNYPCDPLPTITPGSWEYTVYVAESMQSNDRHLYCWLFESRSWSELWCQRVNVESLGRGMDMALPLLGTYAILWFPWRVLHLSAWCVYAWNILKIDKPSLISVFIVDFYENCCWALQFSFRCSVVIIVLNQDVREFAGKRCREISDFFLSSAGLWLFF
jgi:hypothetical protein